jgi:hypothetical protein
MTSYFMSVNVLYSIAHLVSIILALAEVCWPAPALPVETAQLQHHICRHLPIQQPTSSQIAALSSPPTACGYTGVYFPSPANHHPIRSVQPPTHSYPPMHYISPSNHASHMQVLTEITIRLMQRRGQTRPRPGRVYGERHAPFCRCVIRGPTQMLL